MTHHHPQEYSQTYQMAMYLGKLALDGGSRPNGAWLRAVHKTTLRNVLAQGRKTLMGSGSGSGGARECLLYGSVEESQAKSLAQAVSHSFGSARASTGGSSSGGTGGGSHNELEVC